MSNVSASGEGITLNEYADQIEQDNHVLAKKGYLQQKFAGDKVDVCTYVKYEGKPLTQLVYSCITCQKKKSKNCENRKEAYAALCFGCSMNCHLNHEIIELYTKKNIVCDCGNGKFADTEKELCDLRPRDGNYKPVENENNSYNENYEGKYCYCKKPDNGQETMIQCSCCDDWFHLKCTSVKALHDENLANTGPFCCRQCTKKNHKFFEYLSRYAFQADSEEKEELGKRKKKMEASHGTKKMSVVTPTCVAPPRQVGFSELIFPATISICECSQCLELSKQNSGLIDMLYPTETESSLEGIHNVDCESGELPQQFTLNSIMMDKMKSMDRGFILNTIPVIKEGLKNHLKEQVLKMIANGSPAFKVQKTTNKK